MPSTLLLIPGLANTQTLFRHQIEAFSEATNVVVADHSLDDTVEAMARRALAAVPARFALAGLSMGGYVAMEILRQAPERVDRVALLDTTARPDSEEAKGRREGLIRLAEAARLEEITEELWPKLVHPSRVRDRVLKSAIGDMLRATGAAGFIRQQRAIMARPDSRPLLPGVEIPTLVLVGEADAITPPDLAREMADLVEWSSLVVVPEAGHLSAIEQPEAVTQALRLWLRTGREGEKRT